MSATEPSLDHQLTAAVATWQRQVLLESREMFTAGETPAHVWERIMWHIDSAGHPEGSGDRVFSVLVGHLTDDELEAMLTKLKSVRGMATTFITGVTGSDEIVCHVIIPPQPQYESDSTDE